ESKIYDLILEDDGQNSLDSFKSNDDSKEDIYYMNKVDNFEKDFEYKFHYGIFIKLDEKFLPTKWYKITISEVDKFLAEIHNNVITLTKNKSIEACDYNVTFKSEKAAEAGT
ncbi:316_t:CDS:1, partial [Dentiscutata erythropus]